MDETIQQAEVVFVSHSGGKDSQAMLAYIHGLNLRAKIVIVHADLGSMEWEPMHDWIAKNSMGYPVHVVQSPIDFFGLCRKYKRLPSGMARFCTSELKTRPIQAFIRSYCAEHGFTRAINAVGIRAEESRNRAKKAKLSPSKMSHKKTGLVVYDWNPILGYSLNDVYGEIASVYQTIHHVYDKGFSRLSCVFCVFGRIDEHKTAAKLRPELAGQIATLERELGKTIRLTQIKGIKHNRYFDEYCG